eukprot:1726405-Alexandrium_andersonii.AAC.1
MRLRCHVTGASAAWATQPSCWMPSRRIMAGRWGLPMPLELSTRTCASMSGRARGASQATAGDAWN